MQMLVNSTATHKYSAVRIAFPMIISLFQVPISAASTNLKMHKINVMRGLCIYRSIVDLSHEIISIDGDVDKI